MTCTDGGSLFATLDDATRAMLARSPLGELGPDEKVVDLFCGAGGWGEGARELGIRVDFAVNHDAVAIGTHEINNPWCVHHQGDAWKARPRDVVGDAKIGLLMASAACTTHSRARGAAPISPRVHMLGWCIARWMHDVKPRVVLIENVPEWRDWGPTIEKRDERGRIVRDEKGRVVRVQDPKRKGMHFRRWWRYCQRLGYSMEMRVLEAPDYGAASRRKRLFVIARRDGAPIVWPEPTHGEAHNQLHRSRGRRASNPDRAGDIGRSGCRVRRPYRTAAECIDWSDIGTSIFERERPLRPKTLARIVEGIRRFVLSDPAPFLLQVTQTGDGSGAKVWRVTDPLPTQTTRQDLAIATPILATIKQAVISPVIVGAGGSAYAAKPTRVDRPMNTVKCDDHRAIAAPVMAYMNHGDKQSGRVDEPLRTVVGGGNHAVLVAALMMQFYGASKSCHRPDDPLGCVTTLDRHGLVCCVIGGVELVIVDILFRMLRPRELARAMGFREDYSWPIDRGGSQRDTVRLVGNAVAPPMARALVGAVLPGGRGGRQDKKGVAA